MLTLYTLGIRIYGIIIGLAAFFHPKAKLWVTGRKNQNKNLTIQLKRFEGKKLAWIHAASYGEHEMAKPIIEQLKINHSDLVLVNSFFSPSGYENISVDTDTELKIYLPLDTPNNAKALIKIIDPSFVIFIKYDFWFNLLNQLSLQKIPYYFTSIHLNSDSYLFRFPFSSFLTKIRNSAGLYCHNKDSVEILRKKGFDNCRLLGDTRIDQVIKNKEKNYPTIRWKEEKKTVIYGSVCPEDEVMVANFINKNNQFNHIIVPHDIDRESLGRMRKKVTLPTAKFSTKRNGTISEVLLVDTLGDLKYLYKFADLAYVGGGFSKGPHNVLEPIVYGVPTCCGSVISKFPMAQLLKEEGLIKCMDSTDNFQDTMNTLLDLDEETFKAKSDSFIKKHKSKLPELINELNQHLVKN